MTPEQANFLLQEVYLPQIHSEHKTTRTVIEAVPEGQTGYKPDEKSKTAMQLASHIAGSEIFFMHGASAGAFDRAAAAIPENVKTPADLSAWYVEAHKNIVAKLAATKGEDLIKNVPFAIFNLPAITYISLMLMHSSHHRGQLSTYLRPMGSKIPRIYGGSADDPVEIPAAR
jgi:uncharacterized damage-inducible protein DinB